MTAQRCGRSESVGFVEEAGHSPGMTGRACRLDPEQHCVSVTVDPGLDDVHPVPGGSALLPEPARARVEPRAPGLARLRPRLLVHVGEHQDLARVGILDHGRHQAFGEIRVHRLISRPRADRSFLTAPIESSPKWKIEAASAASAPPTVRASYMWAAVPAPPDAITGSRTAELTALSNARS